MSEERINSEYDLSGEKEPLSAEKLAEVTGGAAEATVKSFQREEAEK